MEETQAMTNPITIQNQHQLWPLKVAFNHQTHPGNNRQKKNRREHRFYNEGLTSKKKAGR